MDCRKVVDSYSICNNSYPIAFQNHHADFILTDDGVHIYVTEPAVSTAAGCLVYGCSRQHTARTAYAFRFLERQRRDNEEFLR